MKLLTRKALLQRNATKQRRLDAAIAVQPLLGGHIVKKRAVPSHSLRVVQPVAPIGPGRTSGTAQRSTPASKSSQVKSTSTISRISARDRPLQLPVLKKLRPRGELKPVKSTRRLKVSSRRRTFRAPISIEKVLSLFDNGRYGDFAKLSDVIEQDVTLVAIDTEFERRGLVHHAVEIGISTLSVKDVFLSNMLPGSHAKNWISQMKHTHIVLLDASHRDSRMRGSRFGSSLLLSASQAKDEVLTILRSLQPSRHGTPRIALVGHSLSGDLNALRRTPDLELDLLNPNETEVNVITSFDTYSLARAAQHSGAVIPSFSLSGVAKAAYINPRYIEWGHLAGWHNASNDAAYTMMALLLFLARGWHLKYRKATSQGLTSGNPLRSLADATESRWARFCAFLKSWIER